MRAYLPLLSALALAALWLGGCGGRPLPGADSSARDGSSGENVVKRDSGPARDGWNRTADACVRPPGGCFSPTECPAGHDCVGCDPDPCCPMCAVCYGKCVPSSGCQTNGQCASTSFCLHDYDCGGSGSCQPRPQGCPEYYSPVCGCDGTTYGNPCEAHAAGVSVASQGDCNQQLCVTLNQSYIAAVQQAKNCCSMCDMISCTLKIKTELACPCDTYVEPSNTAAIQTIKTAEQQWNALNCSLAWPCPPMPCPWVSGADCVPTSTTPGGYCMDVSAP